MRRTPKSSGKRLSKRPGVAALLVLVCLSFATVVATLLIQAALAERTYARRIELIDQTDWLVEAGIDRGAAQLAKSPTYSGETWSVASTHLDGPFSAEVRIEVKRTDDSQIRLLSVRAELRGKERTQFESHKEVRVSLQKNSRSGRS
jgi:hypothetical protein